MPPEPAKPALTDKSTTPIIVDLGKKTRKKIKLLRQGKGSLMEDITLTLRELQSTGKISASAQPVIIVVKEEALSFFSM